MQQCLQHCQAMKDQIKLTAFGFQITLSCSLRSPSSPSSLWVLSVDVLRALSTGTSHVLSATLSLAPSPMPSPDPSVGPSITPSPVNSNEKDNDQKDKVEEDALVEEDKEDSDMQEVEVEDDVQEDEAVRSEDKDRDMENFMGASGLEPKEDICKWAELRDQIKADLEMAHKQNKPLMHQMVFKLCSGVGTSSIISLAVFRSVRTLAPSVKLSREC